MKYEIDNRVLTIAIPFDEVAEVIEREWDVDKLTEGEINKIFDYYMCPTGHMKLRNRILGVAFDYVEGVV